MSVDLVAIENEELPAKSIKLVFFDIDGTLIGANGNYSSQTQQQIHRIQHLGVKTAIASGRPHYATQFLVDELGLDATGMFFSGAVLYSPHVRQMLHLQIIAADHVTDILKSIHRAGLYCELYCDKHYYFEPRQNSTFDEVQRAHSAALRLRPQIQSFSDVLASVPIVKLLVGGCDSASIEKLYQLEKDFPQFTFAYGHMASHPHWVFGNILNGNIDKQQAFQQLCDIHAIAPQHIMAIGDAHSDMDFIQAAGVGVAMGNANQQVKDVADFTTLTVAEEGVAYALQRLIPGP